MRCCARPPRKAKRCCQVWTANGSPLLTGCGTAGTHQIVRAHSHAAPVDIVVKDGAHPDSEALFGRVRRLTGEGRIEDLLGFAEGNWWVQDAAATLPALLLGDVAGER